VSLRFRRPALILSSLVIALCGTGCDQVHRLLGKEGEPTPGSAARPAQPFAVIDLEEIARRLGRDQALNQALRTRQNQLSGSISQVRTKYLQQARSFQEEIGENPSEEEQQKLSTLINNMNLRLDQLQQEAARSLSQEQLKLVRSFRSEVRPFAQDIARERGFTTILIRNESVLFAYDRSADITEAVIQRMGTPVVP